MFFSHKYRYLIILFLALYTYISTLVCDVYFYFGLENIWYYDFLVILLVTLMAWETGRWTYPLMRRWIPQPWDMKRKIMLLFACLMITTFSSLVIVSFFHEIVLHSNKDMHNPLKLILTYNYLVVLLFHLLNAVFYYMNQFKIQEFATQELKRAGVQAQLQSIQSQLNPHFLFNNLNVLSSLVLKQQPALANKFIEAFSRVYRTLLENHDKQLITLSKEIEFLDSYMYLLKQRFPDSIHFDWEISQSHKQFHIIPAALQLLVENSIKHNTTSPAKPLFITIRSTQDNCLEVVNNKQLRRSTQEKATGIGLANIAQRYKLILNKEILVTENENEFIVKLPLAKIKDYVHESRDN